MKSSPPTQNGSDSDSDSELDLGTPTGSGSINTGFYSRDDKRFKHSENNKCHLNYNNFSYVYRKLLIWALNNKEKCNLKAPDVDSNIDSDDEFSHSKNSAKK